MLPAPPSSQRALGLESVSRHAWRRAYAELSAADSDTRLEAADLELLASVAFLIGRDDEGIAALTRAHHDYASTGDVEGAARAAFWLGFRLMDRAEPARGAGWLARAARVLEEAGCDECVVHGYLLVSAGIRHSAEGHLEMAEFDFNRAEAIGRRLRAGELVVLARLGQGRLLIQTGRLPEGTDLLDEVMVAVTGGDVSPENVGVIYCVALEACDRTFDVGRAGEWTEAFGRWCDAEPDIVPNRGECLVRRAELMQLRGDWSGAMAEAVRACETLADRRTTPATGAAFYRCGELHRLRGEFAAAETAFAAASTHGREPQPGLALLRLAQGQTAVAVTAIRQALEGTRHSGRRCQLLRACVDVMLDARDLAAAGAAAEELSELAHSLRAPFLRAAAAHASGAILCADGQPRIAVGALRDACDIWRQIDAPYEVARSLVVLAGAYRALGDNDTARLEIGAARQTLERLGAAPDLARADAMVAGTVDDRADRSSPLTSRELEVLRALATGRTNRAIADSLGISEKTVARHVSNIFGKLGLSTRTAAAAYAHHKGLS